MKILLIGESPSKTRPKGQEDVPFSGKTSHFLWNELSEYGINREDCIVTNVVEEHIRKEDLKKKVEENLPRIKKLIKTENPSVIITLGKFASESILSKTVKITEESGKEYGFAGYPVFPCPHPASIARNKNNKPKFVNAIYHAILRAARECDMV
jgi:DNA polymerase